MMLSPSQRITEAGTGAKLYAFVIGSNDNSRVSIRRDNDGVSDFAKRLHSVCPCSLLSSSSWTVLAVPKTWLPGQAGVSPCPPPPTPK